MLRLQQLSVIFILLLFTGCNQQQEATDNSAPSKPIEQRQTNGPLTVTMQISAEKISVADDLILTISALAPEDYMVSFPQFSTTAEDFDVVDSTPSAKKLTGSLVTQYITYTLSPFLPGEYSTPEIEIIATVQTDDNSLTRISFPAHTITVTALLEEGDENPAITDIYAPRSLPIPMWYYVVAGLLLITIIVLVFFLIRRKKSRPKSIPQVPPHITALKAMDTLLGQKTATEHSMFFAKLSLILRHYIEARFRLKAPEQTTEEFVITLGHTPMFSPEHKELLKNFLNHADLIKFAKITPTEAETMDSVQSCRNFVQVTAEKQEGAS